MIWSPPALHDVQRPCRFLAEKNADAASRAVRAIRGGLKVIGHQPEIGRPVADMEPEYREWLVEFGDSGDLAPYRNDGQTAVILAVRHQSEFEY